MRVKQRLVRALIEEIIVDVDDADRQVILVIHWRGGQHSELRVRKPRSGEHTMRSTPEVDQIIRQMGARWSDEHIAATLNRMGSCTPFGHTWDAARVGAYRRTKGIPGYESAVKDGTCLTLVEAAKKACVSSHAIRKLIRDGILPALRDVGRFFRGGNPLELCRVSNRLGGSVGGLGRDFEATRCAFTTPMRTRLQPNLPQPL